VEAILEVKNISKIYGQGANAVVAVDSVSLALNRGEVLLIMGPSGSGKTTLLSMMGCILTPSSGEVHIGGRNIASQGEDGLSDVRRKHIGFVFQSFNLFSSLSAQENVELVLRLKGTAKSRLKDESLALLQKVGLTKCAMLHPADLSGGEKQRTALARALAGDPAIILADEPTANLDSKTGREVLTLLRNLAEQAGKAIAIVSHDSKAKSLAHRIAVLEDGRLLP